MDVVFDTIGGDTCERAFQTLRKGGFLVSAVESQAEEKAKKFGVPGSWLFCQLSAKQLAEINRLIEAGKLKTYVETVLPIMDVKKTHQLSQSGRTRAKSFCKSEHRFECSENNGATQ